MSVLEDRLKGLSAALENASVEKSKQRTLLSSMKKELKETQDFISVSYSKHEVKGTHKRTDISISPSPSPSPA